MSRAEKRSGGRVWEEILEQADRAVHLPAVAQESRPVALAEASHSGVANGVAHKDLFFRQRRAHAMFWRHGQGLRGAVGHAR